MTVRPAEVFPPGEFLRDELEERGWSQAELADILGRPPRLVSEIIQGKRGVTPETAKGLAAALGTSPEYWLNLESSYQLWRSGGDGDDSVARRARLYSLAPVKEMLRRGWIEASDNIEVLEQRILEFFEVDSLDEVQAVVPLAARKSTAYTSQTPAERAWFIRARKLARAVHAGPFSADTLKEAVSRLRLLLHVPQEARQVPRILSEAGIRFVIVEALPNSRIDGACFWLGTSPVIALSLRYDRIDWFWFTLMHELGHIHNGDGTRLESNLQSPMDNADKPAEEKAADVFAGEQLVPRRQIESFIARIRPLYSARRIEAFAQTIHVHPGIVIGQLQYRGEVAWASFRQMLVPVRGFVTDAALTDGWDSRLPAQL